MNVMGDLNEKVGFGNTFLGHAIGRHGLGSQNNNGERFADFYNYHYLVIGGAMFKDWACHKVSSDHLMVTYLRLRVGTAYAFRGTVSANRLW